MKTALTVIKADIGSIGGHLAPSEALFGAVCMHVRGKGEGLLLDHWIGYTGDDIAILMTHNHGVNDARIHRLAWDSFVEGARVAKSQGLYGAGQDLLKDAFSGNVHGTGPAAVEMEIEERAGADAADDRARIHRHQRDARGAGCSLRRQGVTFAPEDV